MILKIFPYILYFVITLTNSSDAQTKKDSIWNTLYNNEGFKISFIFYPEADNYNNGIVVKLDNFNDYGIAFNFKLIFRADTVEIIKSVSGSLKAYEKRTGSSAGLYFIPFKDRRSLSEVGIKGCKITPLATIN